ncbi:MAG: outer membrane protein assembly factor BamD [Oligoflexales bacterium]
MWIKRITCLFYLGLALSCSEKQFDPDNPSKSYTLAKEPYDDENYEIALTKLGEFKSRFPYSKYATDAELLMANSHFELEQYAEATASYKQFIKLHPNHPKNSFAQYRIGQSYWADAPEEVNREQDLTARAIAEWEILVKSYPKSEHTPKALELIKKGKRRMAESERFIAEFYCRQEIWHACAYRYVTLADTAPIEFKDLIKTALEEASFAFEKMAADWNVEAKDKNLYYRKMSKEQLAKQSKALKEKSAKL